MKQRYSEFSKKKISSTDLVSSSDSPRNYANSLYIGGITTLKQLFLAADDRMLYIFTPRIKRYAMGLSDLLKIEYTDKNIPILDESLNMTMSEKLVDIDNEKVLVLNGMSLYRMGLCPNEVKIVTNYYNRMGALYEDKTLVEFFSGLSNYLSEYESDDMSLLQRKIDVMINYNKSRNEEILSGELNDASFEKLAKRLNYLYLDYDNNVERIKTIESILDAYVNAEARRRLK